MGNAQEATSVGIELKGGYRFEVDLGAGLGRMVMDEPAPLGEASGPDPSALLGAAVGGCLSASLAYCLRRAHLELTGLRGEVEVLPVRNAKGRLRIGSIKVTLHPALVGDQGRIDRCLELFEDFCVVTESVRHGIEVEVAVEPPEETIGSPAPSRDWRFPARAGCGAGSGQRGRRSLRGGDTRS